MITIIGRLNIEPAGMENYDRDVKELSSKVIKEDGCHFYSLVVEDKENGVVTIAEIWRDEPALFVHWGQPWVTDFMEKYGAKVTGSTLKMYDTTNERDLPS